MKKISILMLLFLLTACGESRESWLFEQEEIFTDLYHEAFPGEKVIEAWRESTRRVSS